MQFRRFGRAGLVAVLFAAFSLPVSAPLSWAQEATVSRRDGAHDFDFNLGRWRTHIRRLDRPLSGSGAWLEMNGVVTVRPLWSGRGQIEEIQADGAAGRFEGLTLFLYNPEARQWSLSFASAGSGVLSVPAVGRFNDARGEFYSQEPFEGRTILVRQFWMDITPRSHRMEQSFSEDGGRTWELNFIAVLTRDGQ